MTFEPFSIKKDMVYLAIVPDQHNFVTASSSFFKEVSITYEVCLVVIFLHTFIHMQVYTYVHMELGK